MKKLGCNAQQRKTTKPTPSDDKINSSFSSSVIPKSDETKQQKAVRTLSLKPSSDQKNKNCNSVTVKPPSTATVKPASQATESEAESESRPRLSAHPTVDIN